MTHHTEAELPWWRDRTDEIEQQVGMGKMDAMACYTQMVQLLDAERRAPAAPTQKGDYLDGVNIPRLREALTFLGRGNGIGEGAVANKLSEYVNVITRAVLACKELLRSGAPATPVPQGWKPDQPITEEMHVAACKVLLRAHGLDGTPQRMLNAMLAAAKEIGATHGQ